MAFEHGNLIEEPGSETAALLETIYAEALLGVGRQSRSRAVLEKLRKSRSSDPRILCLLGIAHVRAGSLKDGIKYLQQAAKMGYAPAHYELAALTTDRTEKMAHYRQVLILEGKGSPLVNKAAQAVLSERDMVENSSRFTFVTFGAFCSKTLRRYACAE